MKKFFVSLGIIFIVLIVLAIIGFVFISVRGNAFDKESKAYVDAAVPAIVSSWNVQELFNRASPELLQSMKSGNPDGLFAQFRQLGKMHAYRGSKGQALMRWDWSTRGGTIAKYVATAEFDTGAIEIDINLIRHDDRWQIAGFFVKPLYPQQKTKQPPGVSMLPAVFVVS